MKKTIGILGGMGPEASAYFYNLLIKLAHTKYGAVQDRDFPPIIIYNLPLEGFDERGIVEDELVVNQLVEGVRRLEVAGVDFIIIACNTVHVFQEEMQRGVNVPIFSIVDETVLAIKTAGYDKVGLLTSASSAKYKLYEDRLMMAGIQPLTVTSTEQRQLDRVILKVMAAENNQDDTELMSNIALRLIRDGAQAIILGCTELPLAFGNNILPVPILNSNEIITDKALALVLGDGIC